MKVEIDEVVERLLAGTVPMLLKVTHLEEGVIHCGPWKFDAATGAEIDEDLSWGPPPLATGSFIRKVTVQ